jgi:hypothetical protein
MADTIYVAKGWSDPINARQDAIITLAEHRALS